MIKKIITVLIATVLSVSCVSTKKHNALLAEHSECSELSRSLTQQARVLMLDFNTQSEELKKLNLKLDSLLNNQK